MNRRNNVETIKPELETLAVSSGLHGGEAAEADSDMNGGGGSEGEIN